MMLLFLSRIEENFFFEKEKYFRLGFLNSLLSNFFFFEEDVGSTPFFLNL